MFACLHFRHGDPTASAFEFLAHCGSYGALSRHRSLSHVAGLDGFWPSPGCRGGNCTPRPRNRGEANSGARRKSRCGDPRGTRIPRRESDSVWRRRQVSCHASAGAAVADPPIVGNGLSAGVYGVSTKWRGLPPHRGTARYRGIAASRVGHAAKAIANFYRLWMRSISKTRSNWIIRWNCWSLLHSARLSMDWPCA